MSNVSMPNGHSLITFSKREVRWWDVLCDPWKGVNPIFETFFVNPYRSVRTKVKSTSYCVNLREQRFCLVSTASPHSMRMISLLDVCGISWRGSHFYSLMRPWRDIDPPGTKGKEWSLSFIVITTKNVYQIWICLDFVFSFFFGKSLLPHPLTTPKQR